MKWKLIIYFIRIGQDSINQHFPSLNRHNPYYQQFRIRLNGTKQKNGFLEFFNATTNEWIPSCDREFTIRNAQVLNIYIFNFHKPCTEI